jgi:hypothetical protein
MNIVYTSSRLQLMVPMLLMTVAAAGAGEVDLKKFAHHDAHARVHNRQAATLENAGRTVLTLSAGAGDGLAWLDDTSFTTGVIEGDIKGRNNPGASFVGIAFHGLDAKTFEAIYFRPFNFAQTDPVRRAHAVQYISMPDHDWRQLRDTHPGVYESGITPAPNPDDWLHARIVVEAKRVSVFVNGAREPSLVVERLTDRASGWVGFWVGDGSDGAFSNLSISPSPQ